MDRDSHIAYTKLMPTLSPNKPCLVAYIRERSVDREASDAAVREQEMLAAQLARNGHQIIATYIEHEVQPADYGWLEDRPRLAEAIEQATRSSCQLAVLRVDGIGTGDRFPIRDLLAEVEDRGIQVWGPGDTAANDLVAHEYAHVLDVPVPRAVVRRGRTARSKAYEFEHIMIPAGSPAPIAIFVQPAPDGDAALVYLCNSTVEPLVGTYEELGASPEKTSVARRHLYRPTLDGTQRLDIEVAPDTCQWLFSFYRGAWRGETDRYRFTLASAGRSMIAELVVEGQRFDRGWRSLTW